MVNNDNSYYDSHNEWMVCIDNATISNKASCMP